MPDGFRRSYEAFMDSEFWRLDLPGSLDGTPPPGPSGGPSPRWCSAPTRRSGCTRPARRSRPPWSAKAPRSRSSWAKLFADKRWGSTMVLTEPDAGSDVGAGRTRAIPQPDGSWHIEGVKRFITSGEHDLADNIIHYVLARPVGHARRRRPGHQGPVAVHRAEVPLRLGDRRAGRAQRRLRHQRRAQDGPQGLHHLRDDLRRARHPGPGLAARRRARRHPADVPDHRVRPDDGRHQGDRHPVDRLPERAGVREVARTGSGSDPAGRQEPRRGSPSPTTRTCAAR